ncbi:methyl-accepting chemotaxis protein [Myxococcus guangdongensis]|uniref:methyl-accepting chemotaxis protein n=1 Tax=Myxococcus guangdongensis TaxID=2906760 RepID=UPI00225E394F|nr:methyl-accepting chemotaxis protein [Myxococcus guangdongensis]
MRSFVQRRSLRVKFVGLVATLLAAISLFLLAFFPSQLNTLARRSLEDRASGIATVLSSAMAPALDFDDVARVEELLAGLDKAPGAAFAVVLHADGSRMGAWRPEAVPPTTELSLPEGREALTSAAAGNLIHTALRVEGRTGGSGIMVLGFRMDELQEQQTHNLVVVGGVSALLFLVGLGLTFLVSTRVVGPVDRLRQVAEHIAKGDLVEAEQTLGGEEAVRRQAEVFSTGQRHLEVDELGRLEGAFALMLTLLRQSTRTLQDAARRLSESTDLLNIAGEDQAAVVREQVATIQATQASTHELKLTAQMAAERAKAVLDVATRADAAGIDGERSIAASLEGLEDIHLQVDQLAARIRELGEHAMRVGKITSTVKDLADQSNMLALNASIEAARAGEHGRGFSVVAREVRSLADQSIQRTVEVRGLVDGILQSMRSAVSLSESGATQVTQGLASVQSSGDRLRELAAIVRDNRGAVEQIASAVSQQNTGIAHIFSAIDILVRQTDQSVARLETTGRAIGVVRDVSSTVLTVANQYRI